MAAPHSRLKVLSGQAVIIGIATTFFMAARNPTVPAEERKQIASRFGFEGHKLPRLGAVEARNYFDVNPHLEHIAPWMSSIGTGVAFFDFDGDGLANDLCVADPSTHAVGIVAAPGTGDRYAPIVVAGPADYESAKSFPTGCRVGDFNEDGAPDLLAIFFGRSPRIYLNQNGPSGVVLTKEAFKAVELPAQVEEWYSSTALLTDVDGDGHVDIIIGNYFREDDGIFDKTSTALPEFHQSLSNATNAGINRMYLWEPASAEGVRFREVEAFSDEQKHRWTLAMGAADLDKDGLSDLYIANDFGPDTLYMNRSTPGNVKLVPALGRRGFTIPKSKVIGRDSFKGMGIDFADINDDGYFDMFVSNIAGEWQLEESHFVFVSTGDIAGDFAQGIAPYTDESEPLGMSRSSWGWDTKFADFDNDGVHEALQATGFIKGAINRWPELHQWAMGNDALIDHPASWPYMIDGDISGSPHNPFYVRGPDGSYVDLAGEVGMGAGWVSRGFGLGDVDGDGDLDLAVANQWTDSYFFENTTKNKNQFLGIHLLNPTAAVSEARTSVAAGHPIGLGVGTPAVGAFVTVHLPSGATRIAQVDGSNGHSGARSPDLLFGLGELPAGAELKVDVRWRTPRGLRSEQLVLKPGWHTVVLGRSGAEG